MNLFISLILFTGCVGVVSPPIGNSMAILEHQNEVYVDIIRRQLEVLVELSTPDVEVEATEVDDLVEESKKLLQELDRVV